MYKLTLTEWCLTVGLGASLGSVGTLLIVYRATAFEHWHIAPIATLKSDWKELWNK